MAGIHPIHRLDAPYGQPDIHLPESGGYPYHYQDDDPDRESLTCETKADESPEDWMTPDEIFEEEILDNIGIGKGPALKSGWPSSAGNKQQEWPSGILLPIPRSHAEEKLLHETVMASLRKRVAELEEEELFESSMKNFTHRASTTIDPPSGIITVSGNYVGASGLGLGGAEPNAAGLGDQPRPADVNDMLRADIKEVWARERVRAARERES